MKFPLIALSCLAASGATQAFQLIAPRTTSTVVARTVPLTSTCSRCTRMILPMATEEMDADVDLFYDDEDEEDPRDMKVGDIKAELDAMNCDYSDCFERKELEKRLTQARENPGRFQKTPSSSGQVFGYENQFENGGRVGMKSVETSFESLKQNTHSAPKKKETFFGMDDHGVIEIEGEVVHDPVQDSQGNTFVPPSRPASYRSTSSTSSYETTRSSGGASGGGGQSLHGYVEEESSATYNHWAREETPLQNKRQTFFGADMNTNSGINVEGRSQHTYSSNRPIEDSNRWSTFEGIKAEPGKKRVHTNQPSNIPNRWSTFEGIQVEAPGNSGVHFESPSSRNQRLQVEQPKERKSKTGTNDGTTMWGGVRVEPAGTSATNDPFQAVRQQGRYDQHHDANTYFQNLNLEPPKKDFKRANQQEKEKYTAKRDFRYDQQAKRTTFFQGLIVEDVPTQDDLRVSSYKREEQGGTDRDFRYDPQRSKHQAFYNGVRVECAPDSPPPPGTFRAPAVNNSGEKKSRTASFDGVRNGPDDMFNKRTLEQPHSPPKTNGVGPAQSGYEGLWEKPVGGGSTSGNNTGSPNGSRDGNDGTIPGKIDIDGRL